MVRVSETLTSRYNEAVTRTTVVEVMAASAETTHVASGEGKKVDVSGIGKEDGTLLSKGEIIQG